MQGGGAHGAFTWGVLDRLLEQPQLRIEGISGTSAGAMNAAVLAHGYATADSQGGNAPSTGQPSAVQLMRLMPTVAAPLFLPS